MATLQLLPKFDSTDNTHWINKRIKIADFCEFKKELISTKGYSKRRNILPGVFTDFHSSLVTGNPTEIDVHFFCNEFVKNLFYKHTDK